MLHSITVSKTFICVIMVLLMLLLMTPLTLVQCRALVKSDSLQPTDANAQNVDNNHRQLVLLNRVRRETSTPDFIRLVVMRFIYGLASTMGIEERLEGLFNGAFVPPNADGDFFGFGDFDDSESDDFDETAFGSLFGDDVF